MDDIRQKVREWVESPDGQKTLSETAEKVRRAVREALGHRRIDHKLLKEPMDL